MKKINLFLIIAALLCYNNFTFAGDVIHPEPNWTGLYLGGNAGYWWSQNNKVKTTSSVSFINSAFEMGASNIANALAQIGSNNFSLDAHGFNGGIQAGYNYQFKQDLLLGLDLNFNGFSNAGNTHTLQKTVNLADFAESYAGTLTVTQKINYLGTITARLGYLYRPTFLIYAKGGFAYGNVTLNTAWTAQESLGADVFPPINTQNNLNKTLSGWTAGGGIEWLFKRNWSALIEYDYYSLNDIDAPATLAQINASTSPASLWASANANTALSVSLGMISVGINYHFA